MKINRNSLNIIYLFSLEFFVRLIGFAATTYLARVLGTSGFGLINLGLAVLGYALLFGNSGLTLLGTRKIAAGSENIEELAGNILSSRLFFSLVILLISFAVTYLFVIPVEAKKIFSIYLLYLIPFAFLLEWFFQGFQKMGVITIGRIIGMSSYLLFLVLFVKSENDTLLTAAAWVLGGAVNSVILWAFFKKAGYKTKLKLDNLIFFRLIKESISLSLASIIAGLAVSFPVIYLGMVTTNFDIGLYSAASKVIILFLTFDRVFNALFFPKIISCIKNYPEKLEEIFNSILKIVLVFALSAGLVEIVAAKFIIVLIFGKMFSGSVIIFQFLTGYFTFTLLNSVFGYTLIAMNKENIYTIALSVGGAVFILLSIILFKYFAVPGVAAALGFFEITVLIYMSLNLGRNIKVQFVRNLIFPLAGSYLIILPLLLFIPVHVLFKLILIIFVGAPGIMVLSGFGTGELKFLKRVLL